MDNLTQTEIQEQGIISPGLAKIGQYGSDYLTLETPYSPALVAEIKALEDRQWDKHLRVWIVAKRHEAELRGLVRKYFRFEDEKDIPPALLPRFERRRVVVVTRRRLGYHRYGQVNLDGFSLIGPYSGDLLLKANPSFRVISFEGSATIRSMTRQCETNVDENGNWIEEGRIVTVTEQWKILTYNLVMISRVGAEWLATGVSEGDNDASVKFLGQTELLGDPITDIEIGDFQDLSDLPPVGIHEHDIELVEDGEQGGTVTGGTTTLPFKVPTVKRFRLKVREASTKEEVLESLEFLRRAVELAGGRLVGANPQYYRSEGRWGCWFTVERPAGQLASKKE